MRVHLLRQSIPWRQLDRVTLCGRQVSESCRVVEWQKFRGLSLSRKCGSCNSHGSVEHHWTDAVQNELLHGINNGRPGNIVCELEAIMDLVERHRAEFNSLLAANLAEAVLQEPAG